MKSTQDRHGILFDNRQLGPFPMHRLKRVDKPTTIVTDDIQRVDIREHVLAQAARGDYGPAMQREVKRPGVKYPLSATGTEARLHLAAIKDNEVAAQRAPLPEDPLVLSRHIKRLGYFLKVDIVGICRLPEYAVYSTDRHGNPVDINYQFAIVLAMGIEHQTASASRGYDWIGGSISYQPQQDLAMVTHTIANYIRRLGYPAVAQHAPSVAGRYQVLIPPLLLWAGIGEISRAGIILNPFLGMGFVATAVLTNLPLVPDKPIDFGLQDFCKHCKKCAEECPSRAISMVDKVIYNGYETWKLDTLRCASFNIMNKRGTYCNRCVKVCPWTRPTTWPHNLVRRAVRNSSLARRVAIKAEGFLGHEKEHEEEKWWFDLEEVDRVLRIPPNN